MIIELKISTTDLLAKSTLVKRKPDVTTVCYLNATTQRHSYTIIALCQSTVSRSALAFCFSLIKDINFSQIKGRCSVMYYALAATFRFLNTKLTNL